MRQFLVGEVTEGEREAVESRMFSDDAFFDALCALEHEMLVLLARGDLPARWATPLAAALAASPERHRRLRDVKALLEAVPSGQGTVAQVLARSRLASQWWLRVAALVVVTAGAVGWWMRPQPDGSPNVRAAAEPGTAPTFVLRPGPTRAPDQTLNTIDLRGGASRLRLVAVLDAPATTIEASMRPVDGVSLGLPSSTTVRELPAGIEVTWELPVNGIPAGDYLIAYDTRQPDGRASTIGSRFVRILKGD